jgi:hypothetical protein
MINFLTRLPLSSIVLIPLRAPTKVGEHSGLVLPYKVKQAANAQTSLRQAKQCTTLFCEAKNAPLCEKVPLKLYQIRDFPEIGIAGRNDARRNAPT